MKTEDTNTFQQPISFKTPEKASDRSTLNKLLASRDTKIGSRIWQKGAYYIVTGEGGTGVGCHWVMEREDLINPQPSV